MALRQRTGRAAGVVSSSRRGSAAQQQSVWGAVARSAPVRADAAPARRRCNRHSLCGARPFTVTRREGRSSARSKAALMRLMQLFMLSTSSLPAGSAACCWVAAKEVGSLYSGCTRSGLGVAVGQMMQHGVYTAWSVCTGTDNLMWSHF